MMTIRANRLPDATTRGQEKIFAVVSQLVTVSGKTTRHILIIDNHPATLDLLHSIDLTARPGRKLVHVALAIALVLAAGLGIIWPLL